MKFGGSGCFHRGSASLGGDTIVQCAIAVGSAIFADAQAASRGEPSPSVPPARRGNLKEGVFNLAGFLNFAYAIGIRSAEAELPPDAKANASALQQKGRRARNSIATPTIGVCVHIIPTVQPEFIIPPSFRFPPLTRGEPSPSVPPACRGNLKEGVVNCRFL